MEHRWGQRTSTDVAVRLVCSPGAVGTGRLLDVSATGAFVQTSLDLPPLAPLRVELIAGPPPASKRCTGRAYVVRRIPTGVGIEWLASAAAPRASPDTAHAARDVPYSLAVAQERYVR